MENLCDGRTKVFDRPEGEEQPTISFFASPEPGVTGWVAVMYAPPDPTTVGGASPPACCLKILGVFPNLEEAQKFAKERYNANKKYFSVGVFPAGVWVPMPPENFQQNKGEIEFEFTNKEVQARINQELKRQKAMKEDLYERLRKIQEEKKNGAGALRPSVVEEVGRGDATTEVGKTAGGEEVIVTQE